MAKPNLRNQGYKPAQTLTDFILNIRSATVWTDPDFRVTDNPAYELMTEVFERYITYIPPKKKFNRRMLRLK